MSLFFAAVNATATWAIEAKLIVGAYPDPDPPATDSYREDDKLEKLLAAGVDTFVSLQTPAELQTFRDYKPKALALAEKLGRRLTFLNFPVPDRKAPSDDEARAWVRDIAQRMDAGAVIYLHCFGGVGRTGLMQVLLYVFYCNMQVEPALQLANQLYRSRHINKARFKIPQTAPQARQLSRLCGDMRT